MNKITNRDIENKTKSLNSKYNKDAVPPIQLIKIIEAKKLRIGRKDFKGSKIAELDREAHTIYLTKDEEKLQKWGHFAIAHELGHYFLDDRAHDYFDPSTINSEHVDAEDKAANTFAALLLLPEDLMERWSWLDNDVFASAFKVPQEIVSLRKNIKI
jgi:Zn-dependent peptidase ImmA (M78 family)